MVAVSLKNIFFKQKTAYEIYLRVTGVQTCALPILDSLNYFEEAGFEIVKKTFDLHEDRKSVV